MKSNDVKAQAEARDREKREAEQADKDFVAVAKTAEGKRFLWSLMQRCHVFTSSWHPSAQIHFNEGERNIGLFVLNELNRLCPDQYLAMVSARADELAREKRRQESQQQQTATQGDSPDE